MRAKTVSNPSDGGDGNNYTLQTLYLRALLLVMAKDREVPLALRARASFSSCRSWPNGG